MGVTSKSFNARIPHSMDGQDLEMKTMPEYDYLKYFRAFLLSFSDTLVLGRLPPRSVSFTVLSCSEALNFSL